MIRPIWFFFLFSRKRLPRATCSGAREISHETAVRERLVYMAKHDGLTELYNRPFILGQLRGLQLPCVLGMIDLDHFKSAWAGSATLQTVNAPGIIFSSMFDFIPCAVKNLKPLLCLGRSARQSAYAGASLDTPAAAQPVYPKRGHSPQELRPYGIIGHIPIYHPYPVPTA